MEMVLLSDSQYPSFSLVLCRLDLLHSQQLSIDTPLVLVNRFISDSF